MSFPFTHENLAEIKSVNGRKYYSKDKYWTIPLSLENAFLLKEWNYTFKEDLKSWANKRWKRSKNPIKDIEVPGLLGTLFPYQKRGVSFTENKDGRALIADEMGLGKTVQALSWLQLHRDRVPVVIVCPASFAHFKETKI